VERQDVPGLPRGWSDVDRAADTAGYVTYLDAAGAMSFFRDYKHRTFGLLDIRPGHRLLDVGCGTGDDVRALAPLVGPQGRVIGVDRGATMIAEARHRADASGLPVEFCVGDAHNLAFADQAFDGVRVDRTLQHLARPERALAEAVRVLRTGGRVVVAEPDWDTLLIDAPDRAVTRAIVNFRCDGACHGWIGRQLARLLTDAGLAGVDVTGATLIIRDYATAERLFGLQKAADGAAEAGIVERAASLRWLASLKAAADAGRFFSAIVGFIGVGHKP
jgi:ubiquinone/menaquinone biosynthesis C-methylase UbiE